MTARRVSRVVRRTLEVQRLKALMYSSSEVTRGGDRCRVLLLDQVYLLILVQTLEGSVCRVVMHGNPLYVGIVNLEVSTSIFAAAVCKSAFTA